MAKKVMGAERAKAKRDADMLRRAAMFWMLHEAGASHAAIARGAGLSRSRVQQVCQHYVYQLHRRTECLTGRESFMERLRGVGALLGAAKRERGLILEPRFEPSYRLSSTGRRSEHDPSRAGDPGAGSASLW